MGLTLPMEEFFYRPTIRKMCTFITERKGSPSADASPLPGRPRERNEPSSGDIEVSVGSGPRSLPGTFTLPPGAASCPAVVLIHGSGPLDRDSTIGPYKPFRDLAEGLARRGIAVLRYDKRTFRHARPSSGESFTVEEEVVLDAVEAVAAVGRQTGVRSDAVFVLGHSLGAWLTPEIAARSGVAGMVLMAPPGRPPIRVALDQLRVAQALSPARLGELERDVDRILAGQARPGERFLDVPVEYFAELTARNGLEETVRLGRPTLALRGELDSRCTPTDFAAWEAALQRLPGARYQTLPDLDHLLICRDGGRQVGEHAPSSAVHHTALDSIADFIHSATPLRS
jgi:hypothetical protein